MAEQKIILVGPVYPYKGGIAHYNSLLFKTLAKKYDIKIISFKRQYPRLLYPGKVQKDCENKAFQIKDVEYLIDSINPLSWVLTAKKICTFEPELIIFQWWNPFFAPAYLTIITFCRILLNIKVLFICHNVLPHEKMPLDKWLAKTALRKSNYFIVQSHEDAKKLLRLVKGANYKITPHPSYSVFKSVKISKDDARVKLGIGDAKRVLLYFGFVRGYKGLIYLIRALPRVREEFPGIKLLIAGEFFQGKGRYLKEIDKFRLQDNVDIYDQYIPDHEVGIFFSASDLVVLPYVTATQSGIVQIAYGFNRPVIVTRVGGLPEVVEHKKTGYVVQIRNSQQIANAIIDYYKGENETLFATNIEQQQDRFSWDRLVENIEALWL